MAKLIKVIKDKMFELEVNDTDILCDNCNDLIRQQEYYYRDHENEEGLCFMCYDHIHKDPYQDVPDVDYVDED